MAAGDIINSQGISIVEAGSPTWIPAADQSKWAKEADLPIFYYFNGTVWNKLGLDFVQTYTGTILADNSTSLGNQLQALETAIGDFTNDGNAINIKREDATEDVAPTVGEKAAPKNGDTAYIDLPSQKVEFWNYQVATWIKAFTIDYSGGAGLITSVQDTATINFTLAGGELQAAVKQSETQDNEIFVTSTASGLRITKQTLTAFSSFALAQASGLSIGDSFILTLANLEGIPSDGATGPVFRKQ